MRAVPAATLAHALIVDGSAQSLLSFAAEPGFSWGDPHALGILFLGLAFFAAVAALSHQHERAFSASLIYLTLGIGAAAVIDLLGVDWLHPIDDADLLEAVSELAIVIALFGTGLKLDRAIGLRSWSIVWRLLGVAMPLTIGAVALFGVHAMGLPLGVALILGAILAPTDPVLAGDVGVGPPGEEDEREPNFALTGEAGLNDGLAFPFLLLGVYVATEGGTDWLGEWLAADVLYGVAIGLTIGAFAGYGIAASAVWLRRRELLSADFDGWLSVPTVLAVYGLTELIGAYGFLAAFAAGVAFRRHEHTHEHNRRVHDGAEVVEKFGELGVILLIGSMLSLDGLDAPGVGGGSSCRCCSWSFVPPPCSSRCSARNETGRSERSWRGSGSAGSAPSTTWRWRSAQASWPATRPSSCGRHSPASSCRCSSTG